MDMPQRVSEEFPIPNSQILHIMIMFAEKHPAMFTAFANAHLEDTPKIPIRDMCIAIGKVHGRYDAIQLMRQEQESGLMNALRGIVIPPGLIPDEEYETNQGQYL